MTVYVDNYRVAAQVGTLRGRWSHLIADSREELHAFAERLGLRREWFQDPVVTGRPKARPGSRAAEAWHYDVTESKRQQAIALGAEAIDVRELWAVIDRRRARDAAAGGRPSVTLAELAGRHALSVRQPWAGFILGGAKRVENRTWSTSYRGRLVVHAGKWFDEAGADAVARAGIAPLRTARECPRGYLGTVELVDVHRAAGCCAPWGEPGRSVVHWVLRSPVVFAEPVPGPGQRGLYRIPVEPGER